MMRKGAAGFGSVSVTVDASFLSALTLVHGAGGCN